MLLPIGITRATPDFVMQMTLPKSTVFPASSCETTEFTMLMDSFAEPVYSWVTAYDLVLGVNHDYFVEFVD